SDETDARPAAPPARRSSGSSWMAPVPACGPPVRSSAAPRRRQKPLVPRTHVHALCDYIEQSIHIIRDNAEAANPPYRRRENPLRAFTPMSNAESDLQPKNWFGRHRRTMLIGGPALIILAAAIFYLMGGRYAG